MAETYAGWLTSPENTARRDPVGALARTWKQTEGSRPKRSGIAGLTSWLTDPANHGAISERSARPLSAGEIAEAAEQAAAEYRREQAGTRLGLVPAESAGQQPGQGGEILSVIYGQLSRIEGSLTQLSTAGLAAGDMVAVPREWLTMVAERLDQVLAWQAQQDERIAPVTKLLAELADAEAGPDEDEDPEYPEVSGAGVPYPPPPPPPPGADRATDGHPHQPGQEHGPDDDWQEHDGHPWHRHAADGRTLWHAQPVPYTPPMPDMPGSSPAEAYVTDAGTDPATGEFVTRLSDGTESRYMPQPMPPPGSPHVPVPPPVQATPGDGWTYAGPAGRGGHLWTGPPGMQLPVPQPPDEAALRAAHPDSFSSPPLPAAVEDMPPGEQRDAAVAAFRAYYPGQAAEQAPQQPGPPAARQPYPETEGSVADYPPDRTGGLYGGHER